MKKQTESKSILDNPTVLERAIIYARVSTDEQAESGTSIDNQVEKSLAYAEDNNIQVIAIFKEDYTGKVLARPELDKVREMLRSGQADNLIVYKTNRLDRSEWGVNLLILMQELKTLGVSLHYSQDKRRVDLHNPMEAFMYGSFAGWQSGEDHRETVSKLHEGRLKRAKDGYIVFHGGRSPFGYKAVRGEDRAEENQPQDPSQRKKENRLWFFEIDEGEAPTVRLIFQWYVMGDETGQPLNLYQIAQKLNQMNIRPRKKGAWKQSMVRFIINSETYAGVWYYGRRNKDRRKPTNGSIPVSVPAIVSREIWQTAQENLEKNKRYSQRNRKPGRYLLANRLKCGDCGYAMIGHTLKLRGKTYRYYSCRNRYYVKSHRLSECQLPGFNSEIVDTKVWNRLEEISRNPDQLIDGLRGYQAQQESKIEPVKRELAYVEDLIKEKNAEWEDELINLKVLTSKRAKAKKAADISTIEAVIDELEKRKADLLSQLEEKTLTDEQIMSLTELAAQVAADIATLKEAEAKGQDNPQIKMAVYEAKRRLLDVLDLQVTLFVADDKRKAEITAKYCPNGDVLSVEGGNSVKSSIVTKSTDC